MFVITCDCGVSVEVALPESDSDVEAKTCPGCAMCITIQRHREIVVADGDRLRQMPRYTATFTHNDDEAPSVRCELCDSPQPIRTCSECGRMFCQDCGWDAQERAVGKDGMDPGPDICAACYAEQIEKAARKEDEEDPRCTGYNAPQTEDTCQ